MMGAFWGIFAACLVFACITDCRSREVYNITWWVAGAAAAVLLLGGRRRPDGILLLELGGFILLQLKLFPKMYGRADCYAFSVCAVAEAAAGFSLTGYFLHMVLSFLFLAFVQALRHNIGSGGKLLRPVPFLPYITLAFWSLLWYSVTV